VQTTSWLDRVVGEDDLASWQQVIAASWAADVELLPANPIEDTRPLLSGVVDGAEVELWIGSHDRRTVAAARLELPVIENRDLAYLAIHVHPDHRGRGFGRRALSDALSRLRDRGRSAALVEIAMVGDGSEPTVAERLAVSAGGRPLITETRRVLDLPAIDADRLAAVTELVGDAADGYSVLTWSDRAPAERVSEMAALQALMSTDPPQGDLDLEPQRWDAERYRTHEQAAIDRGRRHMVAAACHDASGELVGYTDLGVPSGPATVGFQWDTIVRADHRGHRLGLFLKIANLRQLRAEHPELLALNTWNADANSHMIAVNEAIGFRPMERWREWRLDL
jgi:GNAT superfamily N-acetyltransferase